jgi:DNA repair protein RadC
MKGKMEIHESILRMEKESRPRERLTAHGAASLSDHELLTIIIGSGTRERNVQKIAADLLEYLDRKNNNPTLEELLTVKGMGKAKSIQVLAELEFFRRRWQPGKHKIGAPGDVLTLVGHYGDRLQEYFLCLSLNGAHEVIKTRVVSVGLLNRALVHPREVFADPIIDRAAAVIIAHNHPSGNVQPSMEDREVTIRIKAAGETLGVELLDHVVFSATGLYYSFLENGEL